MLDKVKLEVTRMLMSVRVQTQEQIAEAEERIEEAGEGLLERAQGRHAEFDDLAEVAVGDAGAPVAVAEPVAAGVKVGRNDPCPCGSGKKFKQCHGKLG